MADSFYKQHKRYTASKAIQRGKALKGKITYSLGANSSTHKDCSAFVCYCYGIPRAATGSFKGLTKYYFTYIDNTRNFKEGDIVFWVAGQGGYDCGHTGIYLKNGKVLQCESGHAAGQAVGEYSNYSTWHHVLRPPEGSGVYPIEWKADKK